MAKKKCSHSFPSELNGVIKPCRYCGITYAEFVVETNRDCKDE